MRSEAEALVNSFVNWRVVGSTVEPLEGLKVKLFFQHETAHRILRYLEDHAEEISAVFVNHERLPMVQRIALEELWKLPVLDRYSTVLKIFQARAKTKEAKLQIALAEIPYMRSQLHEYRAAVLSGGQNSSPRGMSLMGGAGETAFEIRRRLLDDRQKKLKTMLESVVKHRASSRKNRSGMPVVAVVGYTNCGKTSLIKAMTNDRTMDPQNRLFATLDVSLHECCTPSGISYFLVDTVGFLSNLPTFLIASFGATLEDAVNADVILHVRDVSHPAFRQQKNNVLSTLKTLGVEEERMERNYVETWNKIDLVEKQWIEWEEKVVKLEQEDEEEGEVETKTTTTTTTTGLREADNDSNLTQSNYRILPTKISATERTGLAELNQLIEDKLVTNLGYRKRLVLLHLTDQQTLSWLYSETTVLAIEPLEEAEEQNIVMVKAWMSPIAVGKFDKHFPDYVVKEL